MENSFGPSSSVRNYPKQNETAIALNKIRICFPNTKLKFKCLKTDETNLDILNLEQINLASLKYKFTLSSARFTFQVESNLAF